MPAKRPTSVTVMAILNIIFGASGLLSYLCLGGLVIFLVVILRAGAEQDRELRRLTEEIETVGRRHPDLLPVLIGGVVLSLVLTTVLLFAGIGLLKMRRWARTASIIYALVDIPTHIGFVIYQVLVLNPAMQEMMRAFQSTIPGQRPTPNPFASNPAFEGPMTAVFGSIGLIYPIALLIIMFRPNVVAAFAGQELPGAANRLAEDEDHYDRRERWRNAPKDEGGGWKDAD